MKKNWNGTFEASFEDMKGKTLASIDGATEGSGKVLFKFTDGSVFQLQYYPDCCAICSIVQVDGDVADLIGNPLLMAEEATDAAAAEPAPENADSYTWCFYKLATVKGYVTLRWLGESNGYYSETATFERVS